LTDFFEYTAGKFNQLVYNYPIRIPERFSLVIRSLLTQEGICFTLKPDFKFLEVNVPISDLFVQISSWCKGCMQFILRIDISRMLHFKNEIDFIICIWSKIMSNILLYNFDIVNKKWSDDCYNWSFSILPYLSP
jgi:hypothetical protein